MKMEDGRFSKVVGKCDICLQNKGMKLILRDVKHVPDIRLNLILIHCLNCEGYAMYIIDG